MSGWRYLFSSMNVLNGLLAAAAAGAIGFGVIPFLTPDVRIALPPGTVTAAAAAPAAVAPPNPGAVDYAVIRNQNLFHPDRKIPSEQQPESAAPKPDVVLYGTLVNDQTSFAFVEDRKAPQSTAGRGKRQIALKKGDLLGGYTLTDIEANRIVLIKGEDRMVVSLDDKGKKRSSEAPPPPATAGTTPGGMTNLSPLTPAYPQTAPSAVQVPASSPSAGVSGARPSPPVVSPVPMAAPSAARSATTPGPGPGAPAARTRRGMIEEVQKLKAARPMATE